jgi:hypothetical protein
MTALAIFIRTTPGVPVGHAVTGKEVVAVHVVTHLVIDYL